MSLIFSNLFKVFVFAGIVAAIGACFMLLCGLLLKNEKLAKAGLSLYFMSGAVAAIGVIGVAIMSIGGT